MLTKLNHFPTFHLRLFALQQRFESCLNAIGRRRTARHENIHRHDFVNYPPAERERAWRQAVAACRELADELEDVLENDRLAERLQPLSTLD